MNEVESNDLRDVSDVKGTSDQFETDKKCPRCGMDLLEIVYGLPNSELFEAEQRGEVILGGCCLFGDDPRYYCKNCDLNFSSDLKESDEADRSLN